MKQALCGRRCHHNRCGTFRAHHRGAHVDLGDIDQRLEIQLVVGKASGIVPKRHLIIRSAIDIVEHHAWQPLARQLSQIADIMSRREGPHRCEGCAWALRGQAKSPV